MTREDHDPTTTDAAPRRRWGLTSLIFHGALALGLAVAPIFFGLQLIDREPNAVPLTGVMLGLLIVGCEGCALMMASTGLEHYRRSVR